MVARFVVSLLGAALLGIAVHAETVLHVALVDEPKSLDPQQSFTLPDSRLLIDLYEGLLRQTPDGSIKPGVAASWEHTPDRRHWTFHLRPDSIWSDGRPVTADDFVFAWRRNLTSPAAPGRLDATLNRIVGADHAADSAAASHFGAIAIDPHTLQVDFTTPFDDLASLASDDFLFPVPHPEDGFPDRIDPRKAIGNGPYLLTAWSAGQLTLRKAPRYWDAGAVKIDKVIFTAIEDADLQFKRFRTGDLDITNTIPAAQYGWIRANMPAQLTTTPINRMFYLTVNCTGDRWAADPQIRRALSLAVDRTLLTNGQFGDLFIPSLRYVPTSMPLYANNAPPDWPPTQNGRDAEARRLWALPGIGRPKKITIHFAVSSRNSRILTMIADMWRHTLRVDVRLVGEDFALLMDRAKSHDFSVLFGGWTDRTPEGFLNRLQSTAGDANYANYASDSYDRLIVRAEHAESIGMRVGLLAQAETSLLNDAPVIPLFQLRLQNLVSPRIHGYHPDPTGRVATRDLEIVEP